MLRTNAAATAPNNATEAKAQNAASFAPPDMVLTRPIKSGPKCPPKLPTELTKAMPAAAAVPDKNAVGKDQKVATNDKVPEATKVKAINDGIGA